MTDKRKLFKDIESEFRARSIAMLMLLGAFIAGIAITMFFATKMVKEATNKVYVVENGKSLLAVYKTNADDNRPAEVRSVSKRLVSLLFTISPDKEQINDNIREAIYLGDSSVVSFVSNLKENKYYDKMIAASASSRVVFDTASIKADFSFYPYKVDILCKNIITRSSMVEERNLKCQFQLRNIPRSDNNPSGLLAERFIASAEIEKTIERGN